MNELPENWAFVQLENLGEWGSGGTPTRTNPRYYQNGTIPWLIIGDLNDGIVLKSATFITEEGLKNSSAKLLPINTLLIAMYGSIGKLGITGIECATNQAIAYCKPNTDIALLKYLFYSLMNSKDALLAQGQGGAQQNINQGILKSYSIPLAPLNEQKRIAEKLDSLLARVDSCQSHLERVPQILKRFRQSVLAAATSGRLTEDWREKNGLQNETRQIVFDDESIDIPSDWEDSELYEVINPERPLCYGVVQPGGEAKGGIPLVRIQDLGNWEINTENLRTVSPEIDAEYRRSRIKSGDLLLSVVGTIGRTAIVPIGFESNIARAIARISCREGVDSRWVNIWLSCNTLQWYLSKSAREVARKTLNLSQLGVTHIALPSPEEQAEIVRRVEKLFAYAERLEARYTSASEHVERLTPSLLAKAFRGELVGQDAGDESAEKLLERIRDTLVNAPKESKKIERRSGMKSAKPRNEGKRISVIQALEDAGRVLSSAQLFAAAGFPADAGSDLVEEFFVEIREALRDKLIEREREGDVDWFSILK